MSTPTNITFRLAKANPKAVANAGRIYPVTLSIPSEDVIYNAEGRQVRIRYAIGEESIYVSEQSEFAKPAERTKFVDGFKTVPTKNKAQIEFLRATNFNAAITEKVEGRGTIFKEMNYEKEAEAQFDKEMSKGQAEAEFWELNKDSDKIRAIARRLGVNIKVSSWRNSMLGLVRKSPEKFQEIVSDPQAIEFAVRLDHVHQAHSAQVITFAVGRWSWSGADAIVAVPKGANKYDYLANWTYEDKEGELTFKEMYAKTQGIVGPAAMENAQIKAESAANAVSHSSFEDILKKARAVDIIDWKNSRFHYVKEDFTEVVIGKSKVEAIERLKEDPEMLTDVKRRLMNF
jgi:hypothetical protein